MKTLFFAILMVVCSGTWAQSRHYEYNSFYNTQVNVKTQEVVSELKSNSLIILDLDGNYLKMHIEGIPDYKMQITFGEMVKIKKIDVLKITVEDPNYQYAFFDNENKKIWFAPKNTDSNYLVFYF